MDPVTLHRMLRAGKISPAEVVAHAPLDKLDETLTVLKRHGDAAWICKALTTRIAKAPLDEFEQLKAIYYKHCG